jgi:hydrogenase maturation factor HypF (carbamoyltransferase family)
MWPPANPGAWPLRHCTCWGATLKSSPGSGRWSANSAQTVAQMLRAQSQLPAEQRCRRWFDAAAGILGISVRQQFEAEAAIALERLAAEYLAVHAEPAIDGLWHIRADGASICNGC